MVIRIFRHKYLCRLIAQLDCKAKLFMAVNWLLKEDGNAIIYLACCCRSANFGGRLIGGRLALALSLTLLIHYSLRVNSFRWKCRLLLTGYLQIQWINKTEWI